MKVCARAKMPPGTRGKPAVHHHYNLGHNTETLIIALATMAYGLWGLVTGHITTRTMLTRRREEHNGTSARLLGLLLIAAGGAIFWYFFIHAPAQAPLNPIGKQ